MRPLPAALTLLCLFAASAAENAAPPAVRTLEVEGIHVNLTGVSDDMEEEVTGVIQQEIELSGDREASPPLADDLADFVRKRYRIKGYADVQADWVVSGGGVELSVQEGTRYTVGKVKIEGADAVPEEDLEIFLTRQTRDREGALSGKLPYVRQDIADGAGLVVRRLQAEGYLNASAEEPVAVNAGDGSMDITLAVKQGPRWLFGAVQIDGETSPLEEDMLALTKPLSGSAFSEVQLENVRKSMQGRWQSRGHFTAEVTAEAHPDEHTGGEVPVRLSVHPGPQFRVTGVKVTDTFSDGGERVAHAILGAAAGEIYDPESIDLLHRRALDTGVFSRLDAVPQATGADTLELAVDGSEAKPITLGLYGGYETFTGFIAGAEVRNVNFLNRGNAVALRAELNGRGVDGSLQWINPAIFSTRNALSAEISAQTFAFKDYERRSLGFRGTLSRRFTRRFSAEVFGAFSLNEAESDVLEPEELGPASYDILSGGLKLTLDHRDSPLAPERGWMATATVEGGQLGGDADTPFVRTEIAAAFYQPISDHLRFAIGGRMTAMSAGDEVSDIPIDLRVFNGGANSVRSFPERELGPISRTGTPLGGFAAHTVSAELSYEVFTDFEIAVFGDAGALNTEDSSIFEAPSGWRYAVGAGIRYKLPIGPLRLDYGWNPDRQDGEPAGAFHVTFGFAF